MHGQLLWVDSTSTDLTNCRWKIFEKIRWFRKLQKAKLEFTVYYTESMQLKYVGIILGFISIIEMIKVYGNICIGYVNIHHFI